jgi:hypothetical protein
MNIRIFIVVVILGIVCSYTRPIQHKDIFRKVFYVNKSHQLVHKKYIIFISRKPPKCFDPAWSSSGRTVSLH